MAIKRKNRDVKISETTQNHAEHFVEVYNRKSQDRLDADETINLALALEDMKMRVHETAYPAREARMLFRVETDVDPGSDTIPFKIKNSVGKAKIIADDAMSDDLPTVSKDARKVFHKIVTLGISFTYSLQDIARVAKSGADLSLDDPLEARRGYELAFDDLASFGEPASNVPEGLANSSDVSIQAQAVAGTWAAKTAEQIVDDVNALLESVSVGSIYVYTADTLIIPPELMWTMKNTYMVGDAPRITALEQVRRDHPSVMIKTWRNLGGTFGLRTGAGAGVNRLMAYQDDPAVFSIKEPRGFDVLPPEARNLAFVNNGWGRTAGGRVLLPLAVKYMDGA